MIISRKRFEAEINKRVDEAICKVQENNWRERQELEKDRYIGAMEKRLIECEKKCGIDHPSHHYGETCRPAW